MRSSITHFATSYLTLGCLHVNKEALIEMLTSIEWKSSRFVKTNNGKIITNMVLDKDFFLRIWVHYL